MSALLDDRVTYDTAECADGPTLAAWLLPLLPNGRDYDTLRRQIVAWRNGEVRRVGFHTVDRILTRLGRHPCEVPESAWRER
jgi:hypothetical protein